MKSCHVCQTRVTFGRTYTIDRPPCRCCISKNDRSSHGMTGALSGRWLITQTLVCNSCINDMFDCCVSAWGEKKVERGAERAGENRGRAVRSHFLCLTFSIPAQLKVCTPMPNTSL